MRTAIGFPSAMGQATVTSNGVATAAAYPASNIAQLDKPTKVGRAAAAGAYQVLVVLDQARPIQFLALVNHNVIDGQVLAQIWPTADISGAPAYTTGSVPVWPAGGPVQGYPSIRPFILPSPVSARSILFTITPTTSTVVAIGGVEVAGLWEWDGISSRDFGVASREEGIEFLGGATGSSVTWSPRVLNGQLDYMKVGAKTEVVQDFQRSQDLDAPFVFCLDYDAPATWPRTTFLARNQDLPPLVGALYRHDKFNFRFTEHVR